MCEVNAYLRRGDQDILLLEKVYKFEVAGSQIRIENLFGEQKFVGYPLKEIDFEKNRMIFGEPNKTS